MRSLTLLLAVTTLLASGCAFTTMEPAHRLEAGEVVAQGGLDMPGFLYIPRASGAVTYGIGGNGDIGAHVGTTLANVNAGASLRYYTGDHSALSLQGDILGTTFEDDLLSSGSRFVIASTTARFGRVLSDDRQHFYGGVQGQALLPITVQNDTDVTLTNDPGFTAGGYLGIAYDTPGNWDFQLEATGAPIGVFKLGQEDVYNLVPTPLVQLGVAMQYRKERSKAPAPRPSDVDPDEERRIR